MILDVIKNALLIAAGIILFVCAAAIISFYLNGNPDHINVVVRKTMIIDDPKQKFVCDRAMETVSGPVLFFTDKDSEESFCIHFLNYPYSEEYRKLTEDEALHSLFPKASALSSKRGSIQVGNEELHYIVGKFYDYQKNREKNETMEGYILPKNNPQQVILVQGFGNDKKSTYDLATAKEFFDCVKKLL